MTRQRSTLNGMLERTTEFRSAGQLHTLLREDGESVSLSTVYRILRSMGHEGEVDVLRTQDTETRYRRCRCRR